MSFFPTFIVNAKRTIYLRINNPFKKKRMMKYPIGIQSFDQIIEGNWVYVDKTDLVYRLVTTTKTCFLSRPRRFGKSLLVSTLDAYFKGRKELFDGLMIAKLEKHWHQYPVFKIDFNGVNFTEKGGAAARHADRIADRQLYGFG